MVFLLLSYSLIMFLQYLSIPQYTEQSNGKEHGIYAHGELDLYPDSDKLSVLYHNHIYELWFNDPHYTVIFTIPEPYTVPIAFLSLSIESVYFLIQHMINLYFHSLGN